MHTIELDPVTDQTLSQLAARSGLPNLEAFRAKLPYQTESAGEFCRAMREGDRY